MNDYLGQPIELETEFIPVTIPIIDFQVRTYIGFKVYWYPLNRDIGELYDDRYWPPGMRPVGNDEELKIGDELLVKGIMDYEWIPMEVYKIDTDGTVWAECGKDCFTTLRRYQDDRPYWISSGLMCIPYPELFNLTKQVLGAT